MRSLATAFATFAMFGSLAACSDATKTPTGPTSTGDQQPVTAVAPLVASIAVVPSWVNLDASRPTVQLTARSYDILGNFISGASVSWRSTDSTIAQVSSSGFVSGRRTGRVQVYATSTAGTISGRVISGYATVNVSGTLTTTTTPTAAPVASVTLSPTTSAINVAGTVQLTAATKDSAGNTLTGRSVAFASSNGAIAAVSPSGLVTALAAGSATITATSEGKSGSAAITVNTVAPAPVATVGVSLGSASLTVGQGTQASATLRDASNNILTGRTITWTTSNPAIATVSATGYVTAVAAGSASIVATSEGKVGSATLTVNAPAPTPVATVSLSPASATITVGGTAQLSATTRDANGNILTGRTITWGSSNSGIATVSASGLVTAIAAGSATVTATSEGRSATATITVSAPAPVAVATVTVSPASLALQTGQSGQLSATTRDANGVILTGRTVSWTSSNSGVATVSASGMVSAIGAGSATITATSEGRSGTASVSVTAPVVSGGGSCPAPTLWGPLTFDNGTIPNQSAQNGWYLYADASGQIINDPTANGGMSYQMSYTYNPGSDQGSSIWSVYATNPQKVVYARMRYKQDPSFDNSGIKKIIRMQGPNGLVGSIISLWGQFSLSADALSDGQNRYINVGANITPDQLKGGWHDLEFMTDLSNSSQVRYKFWIDGQLKMDYTIQRAQSATIYITQFGGTFNAPGATTRDWMDELTTSTQCIRSQ